MRISIRKYTQTDKLAVDQVVRAAWIELAPVMPGWDELAPRLGALTENASYTEIAVAELAGEIVGAVGYVGPYHLSQTFSLPNGQWYGLCRLLPKLAGMAWAKRC